MVYLILAIDFKMKGKCSLKTLSIENLFDLKNVAQPVLTETEVFYVESSINKEENHYQASIFSFDFESHLRKSWGDSGQQNTTIALSPDKKWLSYLSSNNKDKKMQVMIMPLSGGAATQLTHEKSGVSNYLWSDTSFEIFYQVSQTKEDTEKKVADATKFPKTTSFTKLTHKLDGLGFIPEDERYTLKKVDVLTHETEEFLQMTEDCQLAYIFSNKKNLLVSDRLDEENEWNYGQTVYLFDLASKTKKSLTASIPLGSFTFHEMSGDERYALLSGNDFKYQFVTQTKLYLFDFQTETLTCLTDDLDLEVGDLIIGDFQQQVHSVEPMWLNNQEYLFPVTLHGKLQLYKGNLKKEITCLFDQEVHLTGASLDKTRDQLAVTYSTTTTPSKLATLDLKTGELQDLYDPNKSFLKSHQLSTPERFWYKGADDWDIQGWYLAPFSNQKKHAAILYVHGGPQVCYGESFFHEMQVHAANGYGVILLNPRGGNGYGQEFVRSILGDYGNKDYIDLMLGVDEVLAKHPEIDPGQLYVAGGSYGGFMTNWIVGHTDRFQAAVTQRSISNWISFYGTSDIGPFFTKFQLQHDLDELDALWKMSPLAYARNAKTPLLILHGQADLRCPQEQGEQFFVAMKKNQIDTKMILFPQSSHGLSRNGLPSLRVERLQSIVDWFDQH